MVCLKGDFEVRNAMKLQNVPNVASGYMKNGVSDVINHATSFF